MRYLLEEAEEHVSVDCPLVGLVQHDNGVLAQLRVYQALSQQHTVCHVLDHSLGAGAVLETDGVAHLEKKIKQRCTFGKEARKLWRFFFDSTTHTE